MEKKPINFVVKSAREAEKELNAIVEKGGSEFDFGINPEYVTTVTKKSDGTTETEKEREEMNRTLNVMNKSAFAPISIFLLAVAVFTLVFGILTLAKVLPLPAGQLPIAIVLTVVGVLALAGSIVLAVLRNNKKKALLERKDEILKQDQDLKEKESSVSNRTPQWYKDALWTSEGNTFKNASQRHTLKDK